MYILLIKALLWLEYKIVVIIVNSSKTNSFPYKELVK